MKDLVAGLLIGVVVVFMSIPASAQTSWNPNIFGGRNFGNGVVSTPNVFGGENFSNGVVSTPNVFEPRFAGL
jgi:hypothetical protein